MGRFDYMDEEGGTPWPLWEQIVSRALAGKRGQAALAELEEALVALPEKKLVQGKLAADGSVCAVGAYVAWQKARQEGLDFAAAVTALNEEADEYGGSIYDTTDAGENAGLTMAVAFHLAYLNDEQWYAATDEARYEWMLEWVRTALGKQESHA